MIDVLAANQLLDFGARIGAGPRAEEQLQGAVAVHNMLERHRVAYLADEVGMGKTYVALGAIALFRHFQPDFRVLVIAPRENIQQKWMKELEVFTRSNLKFPDLRCSAVDRQPVRPLVSCENLLDFVHQVVVDPRRDFFLRLSSFSLALGTEIDGWRRLRDRLRETVPWLADEMFDLRNKDAFKENFARAICCTLPPFDLVVVDEGHNLKHGFSSGVAARNRVLGLSMGHPSETPGTVFPGYGARAKRVLFLSATPLEENYEQVWNQLDVFGLAQAFEALKRRDLQDDAKRECLSQFLIRRVTVAHVGGQELTKNQYRREWRNGGVFRHDDPVTIQDHRQRLVVALVQKKVAELLGGRFNMSFQIGMLASFESFLETAKLRHREDDESNFDDAEQAADGQEREGIDVEDVNLLARRYRDTFDEEMPHPKMDAVVESLSDCWARGRKTLVFVRRVASVKELKRKLDERYDAWLLGLLRQALPPDVQQRFEDVVKRYRSEKREADARRDIEVSAPTSGRPLEEDKDTGGTDTFFAWFFRGEGPRGVVSGANIQRRFIQRGAAYATFFEDNHVAALLDVQPGGVLNALGEYLGLTSIELVAALRERAKVYLSRAKKHPGADRMDAAQGAALELLKETEGRLALRAAAVWREHYQDARKRPHTQDPPDVAPWLEQPTFFSEIRRVEWQELRQALWPASSARSIDEQIREEALRGQLLATAARLGHALIDLYILTIQRLGGIELRTSESEVDEGEAVDSDVRRIEDYLRLLERQRTNALPGRMWGAYDELSEIAANFELILDANAPAARTMPLRESARFFGSLLRRQQPVGGMSGQVSRTLVQQFRFPGYPFVLVTTDLLQEGEDLHTFCSSVHHYGVSWTPSAMEQRIGRIDRVRSQTDRRLTALAHPPGGDDLLQVYFPHLRDTVEVLQIERVLERMNVFLRLMHEGLASSDSEKRIDVQRELIGGRRPVEAIRGKLRSAFPVPEWALHGDRLALAVPPSAVDDAIRRFTALRSVVRDGFEITWESGAAGDAGRLVGAMRLASGRQQPFVLLLQSLGSHLLVRCISPIGLVLAEMATLIEAEATSDRVRLGALLDRDDVSYDLTVQDDVLLGPEDTDGLRVSALMRRVVHQADRMEQACLSELDQPLGSFVVDLWREGGELA